MKRRLTKYCIVLIAAVLSASCSSRGLGELDRPSSSPREDEQLKDARMRISGDALTLNYADGGILFSRSGDGTISAVRVSDGVGFDYTPDPPKLLINGVETGLSSGELIKKDGTTEWHKLTMADRMTEIYIVVDL
ncbi:MAG: hypothetical protein K2I89_08490 [Muribaculaceae bacterium]|nr:hypothetical protein [Muribaculaceae bacterium]MDE5595593.1 hypothetical protein [Muribaculaceae bacterium]